MSDLKFADTHNLVAFLEKPTESAGFEEIVDFLNANPIKYALTVNPTVYCSCIKQFWDIVKAKTVNGEVQLQALVDKKNVIITKSIIRRDLQLEDAEGTDCLPNATIFEQLTLMGYEKLSQKLTFYKAFFSPQWKFLIHTIFQCLSAKTTAWNEFSSTMASAIICLARNQKFNFSKYIFDSMVKNVDSMLKFWMYPRFVQVFVNQQVGDMSHHKRIYVTPSHTRKIFANMKRDGKGFSGKITPLFQTMMVQAQEDMGEGSTNPTDPHHTPTITQPSTSQPQKKQKPMKKKRKDTELPQSSGPTEPIAVKAANEENVPIHSNDLLLSGEDSLKLNELMELCTNLQKKVLDLVTSKTTQALEIKSLKRRVVSSDDEANLGDQEDASKQERKIYDIDADEDITLDSTHFDTDPDMFGVHDLDGDEVFVETEEPLVNTATTTSTIPVSAAKDLSGVNINLAQALVELKNTKLKTVTTAVTRPKAKGLVIQEQEPMASTSITSSKDKGKGIMVEEPLKMKKKDQVLFDKQEATRLQAQFDEVERIAREKEEANATLIVHGNDIQDKVETDYELAQRLQAEEQEELTIKEKSKLFQQLLEKRKKHTVAKRAEEKRNRPPTKAQ
ncbi:hypothetical protein Tco_1087471 [Tanacetum coccineum]